MPESNIPSKLKQFNSANKGFTRFIRFCIVGGTASGLYLLLASALTVVFPGFELGASVVAYLVCIAVSFYLQRNFTFRSTGRYQFELPKFLAVSISGLIFSTVIVFLSTSVFSLSPFTSYVIVFLTIPLINYVLFSRYVFR